MASNSQQGSPIMSPDATILTTNSSVQASPEPLRGRGEDLCPPSFELPDPILSHKISATSIGLGITGTSVHVGSPPMISECFPPTSASVPKGSLMRRLSSRASRSLNRRRRQSSTAPPASRDGSIGPCFLRRRSDSNTTAPPDYYPPPIATDSESDLEEKDDLSSIKSTGPDGGVRDSSANSTNGSISGSSSAMAGPVLPCYLQNGTWLKKVSKKNRSKRVSLAYDPETNKISWDKAKPHKFLHVDEVIQIRYGSDIQQYARDFNIPEFERDNLFSILYAVPDKKSKFVHFIADDTETSHAWITFLEAMLRHRQEAMSSLMTFNDKAIGQYWLREMNRQFGEKPRFQEQEELDIAGVKRVCQNLHIYSSQAVLRQHFIMSDARRRERLNFAEFRDFVRRMNQREDVSRIVHSVAARPDLGLTLGEFLGFIRDVQGEDLDTNQLSWERTFTKFARKYRTDDMENVTSGPDVQYMSEAGLVGFLTSPKHNKPLIDEIEPNLDRPMNEYYISSSHNTYLLGRQVAGQSSVEGYISALTRGCRCVEVDCWDGPDGQPLVLHGRTMTSAISFKETMTTINKWAFYKTAFPLWISLEVHCNPSQQAIMAATIKEAFGERLILAPLDSSPYSLPSPNELKGRIVIKVKTPGMKEEPASPETPGRRRGNSLSSPLARPSGQDTTNGTPSTSVPQSPLLTPSVSTRRLVQKSRVNTITEGEVQELLSSSSTSDNDSGSDTGPVIKSANKTVKVLGDLGVYCAGVKFNGFDTPEAKKFNHIFSFMESSFARNSRTKDEKMALDIHNMRYMMRVYPDGRRVGSSNFDPLIYWRRGVQMAALNWQTFDLGMHLNHAMFEGGGDSSGYVLKPAELRDIQVLPFNSAIAEGKKQRSVVSFSINVLSAQQLMRPANLPANKSMDPYVEVEVFHANDKRDKKETVYSVAHAPDTPRKCQTEVIRGNGFNPMFNCKAFRYQVTTKHPELIFVRFSVRLSADGETYNKEGRPPMATYTAKLVNLKQGYRTLPLLNHVGDQYLFSTLFCKIDMESIEEKLVDAHMHFQESGSKLNRLGGKVFGRMSTSTSTNTSPRGTMEMSSVEKSSVEKSSFESHG
jgi:phosphatidylinositol phospholipase C delta